MKRILVLGVGNVLLTDEGIGVHALELLQQHYRLPEEVEVIDGGTSGMDLLDQLAGRECVVLVDAVKTGDAPGTVVRLAGDALPAFFRSKISPHQLGLSDLLAILELRGEAPAELVLHGMVPFELGTHLGLSEPARARMPEFVERVAAELRRLGAAIEPVEGDGARGFWTAAVA
ncbi:MAG: HyaD/HybD family hydrogenase maturation endopeptidase [Gammaproteobacteria bacterium]|nr:HyaD/HybD family hydrogenase maturation endopeptidase [Gammaproteobacteria bacterium]